MLWLALRFASLPLDVYARASNEPHALAVVSDTHTRAQVIACNALARTHGVKPGMTPAAASALSCDLRVVARDIASERAALERIAAWAIQFTPAVSIAGEAELLLEIEGSLAVLGPLTTLWRKVTEGLRALGYAASIACAPTPLAAQWLARAGFAVRLSHVDALVASVRELPIEVMHIAPEMFALLQNVGVKTIGDCLGLPRDAVARRLGQTLLDDVDRALGVLPDPRAFFTPPVLFRAAQPLPAPAHEAEMLVFAARRLLVELCGYLSATSKGVQRVVFSFAHHRREATRVTLSLVAATRDADHLTNVLRERLERTALPCAATDVALDSEVLLPLASSNLSLLPDAMHHGEAAAHLIERLRARLGDEAVLGLKRIADHRPERAWATCDPLSARAELTHIRGRPLLLLAEPRALGEDSGAPCYDGRLTLLAGPERIESGWWDSEDIARDYFVASNAPEALLWIYRERGGDARWFLHGFFA